MKVDTKIFHLCLILLAIIATVAEPVEAQAQEITIAYSKTGIDTLFKVSHLGEEIKTDTLYFFAPATWVNAQNIFHPIREHYISIYNLDAMQDRMAELEAGWKTGILYTTLTKAHDAKVDSLRRYISKLDKLITGH